MERRTFVKGALATAGLFAGSTRLAGADPVTSRLGLTGVGETDALTPVKHLVVVMQENRSVDHYLGWYHKENEDFDARQKQTFREFDAEGKVIGTAKTENWGAHGRNNFHGRDFDDPSHSWGGGRAEFNEGKCDGWLTKGENGSGNDEFCLSYYDAADVPIWAQSLRNYQAYDRWFASLLGPTQPNRFYQHSGQSGGLKKNDLPPQLAQQNPIWLTGFDWPTIWTQLEAKGISAAYYYCNLPEIAYFGARHASHARHISEYYAAAAAGTLPQVAFVDPWFIGPDGFATDDHPHADLRLGQAFQSDVIEAFVTSPLYEKSAMVVTYDEWGGFFDHVPPPRLPDRLATNDLATDFGQLGFRVPSTIISPWTRTKDGATSQVGHTVFDHTSVLKFITDNWGLGSYLTTRIAGTNSLGLAFNGFQDFDPSVDFTRYDAPLGLQAEPAIEDLKAGRVPNLIEVSGVPKAPTGASSSASIEPSDLYRLAETGWFETFGFKTDWRFEDSFLHSRPELLKAAKPS